MDTSRLSLISAQAAQIALSYTTSGARGRVLRDQVALHEAQGIVAVVQLERCLVCLTGFEPVWQLGVVEVGVVEVPPLSGDAQAKIVSTECVYTRCDGRPLRYVPPDSLVEVICRTLHGRHLLRPSRDLNEIVHPEA